MNFSVFGFALFLSFSVNALPSTVELGSGDGNYVFLTQSESSKKRIFKELVRLQDSGYGKSESERVVMNKYGLSSEQLYKILMEGYRKDWLSETDGF